MVKLAMVRKLIREAYDAATFERAAFHGVHGDAQVTQDIRETTRVYREAWILPQLDHAMRLLGESRPGICVFCLRDWDHQS